MQQRFLGLVAWSATMVTMGYTTMQQSNTRLSMQQWFLGLVAWSATMATMGYTAMQQSNTRLSTQQWFIGLVAWSATMATMGYTAMQQVCTSLQTDNHASTPSLSFLQAGCPSCRPTNSFKHTHTHTFNGPFSGTTRVPFLPPNQQRQTIEGNTLSCQQHNIPHRDLQTRLSRPQLTNLCLRIRELGRLTRQFNAVGREW